MSSPFSEVDHFMQHTSTEVQAMALAIAASRQARLLGDNPFGATLVSPAGDILHTARNTQNTTGDCTAHAELVLVREATAQLGAESLRGATVFASGEPCAMCSGAMFWTGVKRVVFAATTKDIGAALGGPSLPARCSEVLGPAQPPVIVEEGLLREDAVAALNGR